MKICTNCKNNKELSNFNKNKSTKDGYALWCKNCEKEYRILNKEKIKEKIKLIVNNTRTIINNTKKHTKKK